MAAYNNIDDVTKKRLEKNHEKMQEICDDPVVAQMLETDWIYMEYILHN